MPSESESVERTLREFDAAWARRDLRAIVDMFAEDASLESPLVLHLLHRTEGVLHGRDEIQEMISALLEQGTPWGRHEAPLIQGNKAAVEFRSASTDEGQFYSVDIVEVVQGRIQSLRAYSGWRASSATVRQCK